MPIRMFFISICFGSCFSAVTFAQESTALPAGNAKTAKDKPYSKTLLMSSDGKSTFAVHASKTDLGGQVSDFLLDPSRRMHLATFSRETFESRRQVPHKFVHQLLIDCQKK